MKEQELQLEKSTRKDLLLLPSQGVLRSLLLLEGALLTMQAIATSGRTQPPFLPLGRKEAMGSSTCTQSRCCCSNTRSNKRFAADSFTH